MKFLLYLMSLESCYLMILGLKIKDKYQLCHNRDRNEDDKQKKI